MSEHAVARSPQAEQSVRAALRSPRRMRIEFFGGIVVALALIPEAISFSIIAGVDPRVGLFASFTMAVSIAIVGGRPAMISAATGSVALVVAPLSKEYGLHYLVATVILAGAIQVVLGALGVAKLMRFIPRSVMVGFVNALAILIFMAQLPHLIDVPYLVYPMVVAGIAMIVLFPKLTTVIPAPLVAIVVLTAVTLALAISVPNVGDEGALPHSLPSILIPDVPFTWETLTIIAPVALAMAVVGLLESLLTAKFVDDLTDTHSNKSRESVGQGIANMVTGLFGGMGGCAMIGQTMINVKGSGARTRISTFLAGAFLLALVVGFGDLVAKIPMAALVAVMVMVSVGTMDWHSLHPKTLRRMPRSETLVMASTVIVTVISGNLAYGVIVGVIVAMVLFARRVAHLTSVEKISGARAAGGGDGSGSGGDADVGGASGSRIYKVRGELFFASSNDLVYQFDYVNDPGHVVIDLTEADIWDASTVATLDAIRQKYAAKGKTVEVIGLDGASLQRHDRLSGHLGGGH